MHRKEQKDNFNSKWWMLQRINSLREAAKKSSVLMAGQLRGGGGKGPAIKEIRTYFYWFVTIFSKN